MRRAGQWLRRMFQDERVRFVVVGVFNTGLAYVVFVAFELLIGRHTGYLLSLYVAYAVSVLVSFGLHRHFTFRVGGSGSVLLDFIRFQTVSLVALGVNTLALPILVEVGRLTPIVAQAIIVILTTIISYLGHKLFSFRRTHHDGETHDGEGYGDPEEDAR